MSLDTNIYKISSNEDQIIFTRIGTTHDEDLTEDLQDECQQEWHMESECGFIGELPTETLEEVLNNYPDFKLKEPLEENSFYRISVSY